jgi:hypothetical protein
MLPLEDRVLLQDTLVSLSVEESVISDIMEMLSSGEDALESHPPMEVQPHWFGGSFTGGTRLATNASQASTIVEAEMKNMIAGLRQHRESIQMFADDVKDTDESVALGLASLQNSVNCTDLDTATTCAAPTEGS